MKFYGIELIVFLLLLCEFSFGSDASISEGLLFGAGVEHSTTDSDYKFVIVDANFKFKSTPILTLDMISSKRNDFGGYAKFSYIPNSGLVSGSTTIGGVTYDAVQRLNISSYSTAILHGGGVYRFDKYFYTFGLNLSYAAFEKKKSVQDAITAGGGIGVDFAINYSFNENLVLSTNFRRLSISYSEYNSSTPTVNDKYFDAVSQEITFGLKYFFAGN